jgi:sensor histidine kinase regulating citrate/malate metabolism
MDENLMNQILATNKKQLFWQRIIGLMLVALVAVVITVAVILVPEATTTLRYIDDVALKEQETLGQIDEVAESLIASSDNLNKLVDENAEELTTAVKSISEVDFEGLNKAIKDFQDAVGPLASFMNRFR